MNKKILFLVLLGVLVLPSVVFAQLVTWCDPGNLYRINSGGAELIYTGQPLCVGIYGLIDDIESAIWIIFALIALICFVLAGILFLTAQGAPDKLQAAKSAFIWGVVGIIVGIVAYSIIAIVANMLGANSGYTNSRNTNNRHNCPYGYDYYDIGGTISDFSIDIAGCY